jgi:hypothetical protein
MLCLLRNGRAHPVSTYEYKTPRQLPVEWPQVYGQCITTQLLYNTVLLVFSSPEAVSPAVLLNWHAPPEEEKSMPVEKNPKDHDGQCATMRALANVQGLIIEN